MCQDAAVAGRPRPLRAAGLRTGDRWLFVVGDSALSALKILIAKLPNYSAISHVMRYYQVSGAQRTNVHMKNEPGMGGWIK
jgi:hypothetical protein